MKKIEPNDPESRSADLVAGNLEALRGLYPEAFTEGKIDFDVLRQLLGGSVDEREERFGLNWHGKRQARQLALTPSTGTLRPRRAESLDWEATQNVFIEGDNLEVLKLLQKSYQGTVKLVYIDPPYNTGGTDFVYPDQFRDNIKNYLMLTGQVEGDGTRLGTNSEASGRFHTAWLNMMLPRLKLARNLLREDGVLLVSINDIEAPALRFVLDEVFGPENFLCQFVWNNEGNIDQQSKIKGVHEYVLCYCRSLPSFPAPRVIDPNIEESSKLFNDQIENSITKNGPANPPSRIVLPVGFPAVFAEGSIAPRTDAWPHIHSQISVRDGKLLYPAELESGWSSRNLLELFIKNGCSPIQDSGGKETWFALTASGAIYGYKRRSEDQGHVLSVIRNVGTTKKTSNLLREWGVEFSFPKPVFLVQYLISIFTNPDGASELIVDFFAGSGTTAEATLRQNACDRGARRFVAVQLPQAMPLGSSSRYATLAEMAIARIRRASAEVRAENPLFAGDLGFRVYRLDATNFKPWDPQSSDLGNALLDAIDHIKPDRNEADLLTEILLKLGLELTVPIETRVIAHKTVYNVGLGALIACLAPRIARSDAEPLALGIVAWHREARPAVADEGKKPARETTTLLFRDSAFADDVAKANLSAILSQHGLENVRSV